MSNTPPGVVADHRVRLGETWDMWRTIGLRGPGFPAREVLRLSAPEAARAADRVVQAQERAEQLKAAALEIINDELDVLRKTGQWDCKEKRVPLLDGSRNLKAGKRVRPLNNERADSAIEAYRAACDEVTEAEEDFSDIYKLSTGHVSEAIREIAAEDRFCEAVTWQNRNAFHTAIDTLLRKSPDASKRGSKQKQYEELVANYLQRYCVKNDTIGFFGPVGWAKFDSHPEPMTCKPGTKLLAARKVFFEEWCINELALTLAKNEAIKPWMIPSLIPRFHVEGTALYSGFGWQKITEEQAIVLRACDGDRTAKQVAEVFAEATGGAEGQVYEMLDAFVKKGVIFWGFYIPLDSYPEESLRKLLHRIEREDLRNAALAALDELEQARGGVTRAAGNPAMLDAAMNNLDATFERLTSTAATRSAGEVYAARTLVYEDCRRDMEVTIGPEMMKELAPPLSLLLTAARWLTFEAAKAYRERIRELYQQLSRKTGSSTVEWTRAWSQFQEQAFNPEMLSDVLRDFQERWLRVLSPSFDSRRLSYTTEELREKINTEFAAPGPGWKGAHFHSPDVMLAASGLDAIKRGDYQFVMGELHVGANTLAAALFTAQHDSIESLKRAVEIDIPAARIIPVPPKNWPRVTARTSYSLVTDRDFRLEFGWDAFAPERSRALTSASVVFEEGSDGLVAKTRDGQMTFDVLDIIDCMLSIVAIDMFKIFKAERHSPRVTIDRLVVLRETWRHQAEEIEFAYEKDDAKRFIAARRWAQERGIPRFAFAKVPVELKPFYVDFNSPIYVDILSKMIRRTKEQEQNPDDKGGKSQTVTMSEMLPVVDQAWLQDSEGRRYTSEFRLVAVDLSRSLKAA